LFKNAKLLQLCVFPNLERLFSLQYANNFRVDDIWFDMHTCITYASCQLTRYYVSSIVKPSYILFISVFRQQCFIHGSLSIEQKQWANHVVADLILLPVQ